MKMTTNKRKQVLTTMLAIAALTVGQNVWAWDGNGTIESPYLINSADELNLLATNVNSGTVYSGTYFKLNRDIDYNGESYTAIGVGTPDYPFRGTFDGDNKTVSGIRINGNKDLALFGRLGSNATVKNVTLIDAVITGSECVGGIVGFNSGTVQNCLVLNSSFTADSNAGAIVGENHGTLISNYYYDCTVNNSTSSTALVLYNDDVSLDSGKKNTAVIAGNTGAGKNVILYGRTLYKDGAWNTLCLPFNLTISGSVLDGADVRTLSSTNFNSSMGELTLNFTDEGTVTKLAAGTPYIIKWSGGDNIVNPVFTDVEVQDGATNISKEYVDFICTYSSVPLTANDKTKLYLGAGNSLYFPSVNMNIGACRAYFLLKGIAAGDKAGVRSFKLSFGDEESGIADAEANSSLFTSHPSLSGWFTVSGVKLDEKPTQRGMYINNGRKVVIKQ